MSYQQQLERIFFLKIAKCQDDKADELTLFSIQNMLSSGYPTPPPTPPRRHYVNGQCVVVPDEQVFPPETKAVYIMLCSSHY